MTETNSWVDYKISRGPIRSGLKNKVGLVLTISANPILEDFMRQMSKERRTGVDAYGDNWVNMNPTGGILEVYEIEEQLSNRAYTLGAVGMPLVIVPNPDRPVQRGGNGEEPTNLSFLKLVGISQPGGVSLGLVGAYSWDYIMKLRNNLSSITKTFLHDYIVPISIHLQIVNENRS